MKIWPSAHTLKCSCKCRRKSWKPVSQMTNLWLWALVCYKNNLTACQCYLTIIDAHKCWEIRTKRKNPEKRILLYLLYFSFFTFCPHQSTPPPSLYSCSPRNQAKTFNIFHTNSPHEWSWVYSFFVTLFNIQKSTHGWCELSFFLMKKICIPCENLEGWMKPMFECSSNNSERISSAKVEIK